MTAPRLLVAVLLLAALAGGAGALAWWFPSGSGAPGGYEVEVLGPEGPLFEGTVELADPADATALGALRAAAAQTGLALDVEEYPGMGAYVRAVGGHRAEGASGWLYEVRREGAWTHGDRSAAFHPLEPGDAVRWSWTRG